MATPSCAACCTWPPSAPPAAGPIARSPAATNASKPRASPRPPPSMPSPASSPGSPGRWSPTAPPTTPHASRPSPNTPHPLTREHRIFAPPRDRRGTGQCSDYRTAARDDKGACPLRASIGDGMSAPPPRGAGEGPQERPSEGESLTRPPERLLERQQVRRELVDLLVRQHALED